MRRNRFNFIAIPTFLILLCFTVSCQQQTGLASQKGVDHRPNILWLVAEDLGLYLAAYGDSTVATPNLNRLANEGVRFSHVFSPSGVCAPSRAAIATGLYPSSFGANHMRTSSHTEVTGLPKYEAIPPAEAKMLSERLRLSGYFCTNNLKTDYQFTAPPSAWDENGPYAHWRNRAQGQPFYAVFNFNTTHESGLFEPYGYRQIEMRHYQSGDTSFHLAPWGTKIPEHEITPHLAKDVDLPVPPYLPDNAIIRRDLWKLYNNLAEIDQQIGAILDQLEADGLLEKTIIFFYGDHGGPLPRQKRLIYDSGLQVPMIVRFPEKKNAGTVDTQLVSFIDFAPTLLSIAGEEIPSYLHGRNFIDSNREPRTYIHAAADRFDGFTDAIRAVRDTRFKYIRNYRPEQPYYLPITYRESIPSMQELIRLNEAGELTPQQAQWFRPNKPAEELFDCLNDPHELHNLAADPQYASKLAELRGELDRWIADIGDQPNLPERELIHQLWKGKVHMPTTAAANLENKDGTYHVSCATPGASIAYRITREGLASKSWKIYTAPIALAKGEQLEVIAHRIGYIPSDTLRMVAE